MKKELLAILFLFLVVLISVSLLSYSPLDPSINHQSFVSEDIHNLFGLIGAHLSAFLVETFGIASLWLPLLILLAALYYLKEKKERAIAISMVGGLIIMLSTSGLLSIIRNTIFIRGGVVSSGGLIGSSIADFLLKYTNTAGAVIIIIFFIFAGVVITTGISAYSLIIMIYDFIFKALRFVGLKTVQIHSLVMTVIFRIKDNSKFNRTILKNLTEFSLIKIGLNRLADLRIELKSVDLKSEPNQSRNDNANVQDADFSPKPSEQNIQTTDLSPSSNNQEASAQNIENTSDKLSVAQQQNIFTLPPISLLNDKINSNDGPDMEALKQKGEVLENKLKDFGVKGEIVNILPGPVITTFEYRPAPGIKISKIANLSDDLALALSALSIRIVAPIPGKDVVGIEIPNDKREFVFLKELISSREFIESDSCLTIALGRDIIGNPVSAAMNSMPHLLIAGATGTGKSVGLNSMIISLLYKAKPDEVKFIMVDPKRIELSVYDGIPHLISPVVTDMKKATNALFWAVKEMDRRYELLAQCGVRNLLQYNKMVEQKKIKANYANANYANANYDNANYNNTNYDNTNYDNANYDNANYDNGDYDNDDYDNDDSGTSQKKEKEKFSESDELQLIENSDEQFAEDLEKLPYIVIIVDEFADLMMVASRDVESALIRLAQMARAAGIHLILATQRPSVDVLTGIIKANFPTRISFQVSSRIDSRTILDTNGSERLLGNGDMLFLPPGTGRLQRIQGAFISEEEIARVTAFMKEQQSPDYVEEIMAIIDDNGEDEEEQFHDEKYDDAVALVVKTRQASISSVQRHFRIGYNRAARIIETMEKEGIVGPQDGSKPREVLVLPSS